MDPLLKPALDGHVWQRALLRTRLVFGFYCPVSARASFCYFLRFYCFCVSHALIIMLLSKTIEDNGPFIPFLPLIIEYYVNAIISFITGDFFYLNFLHELQLIDCELGHDTPLITPTVRNIYLFICAEKPIAWLGGAVLLANQVVNRGFIAMMVMTTAIAVNGLIIILPLDLLRHRLRLLNQSLEINLKHSTLNNTDVKVEMIQNSMKLYKKLLDNFNDMFNSWSKLRISISVIVCFHVSMITGYTILWSLKFEDYSDMFGEGKTAVVMRGVDFISMCVLVQLPALFSELVSSEYDQLKVTIGNLLISSNEDALLGELEVAATYLQERPFQVTICRVCKLDGQLATNFAMLCITNLIIIIQITGLI